jgi:hypothetical protein
MRRLKMLAAVTIAGLTLALLTACEREGPMERAGKEIDRGVERSGEAMEKAGDKIKDATDN